MTLDPGYLAFDTFGGLRLDVPPALVNSNEALDLLDVDWDDRGVLGSRMGVDPTAPEPTQSYDVIFGAGVDFSPLGMEFALLARRNETLVILDEDYEEKEGTLAVSTGRLNFCQMGLGSLTPITYIANQNEPVRKFDGEAFSSPTATVDGAAGKAMPRGHFVVNWQDEGNRLVVANTTLTGGPAGAGGSPAHVFFSDPGQPESFESTAFVQLNPGDGQQIMGVATWGRQVFVFKETYCFVFYGISSDEEGKPIFNFRTVDLGTRALAQRGAGPPNVVAGREGVYFLARDGVWVTTGGMPTRVSGAIDLSEDRRASRTSLGGMAYPTWQQAKGLAYVNGCLYVGFPEEAGEGLIPIERLLKIYVATGKATYWQTAAMGFTVWSATWGGVPRLFFSGAGEANKGIYFFDPESDFDVTVEMNPYYESGVDDLGNADEKTLTNTKAWGSGTVQIAVASDYGSFGTGKEFALGAEGAIAQRQDQRVMTSTLHSHRISGEAPWSIQRLARYLRETRVPATQKQK